MGEIFCHNCGHRNLATANFCPSCGASLAAEHGDLTVTIHPVDATGEVSVPDVDVHIDDFRDAPGLLVVKRGTEGVGAGATFSLEHAVTKAGRSPDSEIFLDDVTVSRAHAEFQRSPEGGYSVVDLASMNGTYVNKERITQTALRSGDEVQIGKFRLVFLFGGDSA